MVRYGGPKWIPRGGIPRFRRRRRPMAWICNGTTDQGNADLSITSALAIDRHTTNGEGLNVLTVQNFPGTPTSKSTQFLGFLATTFDDKVIEAADEQSVNQADALDSNLTIRRIQGWIQIENGAPSAEGFTNQGRTVGFMICHQRSESFDDIDQLDYVDPSLWRGNTMIHSEVGTVTYLEHTSATPTHVGIRKEHIFTRNLNLSVRRRMRKNEVISLWLYSNLTTPQGYSNAGVNVSWALRCLASR